MNKIALSALAMICTAALATPTQAQTSSVSEPEAYEIARDAYVYAYPALLMDVFMRQGTNYAEPTGIVTQGPYNQFSHARAFPPADFKAVVRPNVDTLYPSANLDLGPEPLVLSVPATDRYFMLPLLSLWTDVFAVPGTRTTGRNTAREFLLSAQAGRDKPQRGWKSSAVQRDSSASGDERKPTAWLITTTFTEYRRATSSRRYPRGGRETTARRKTKSIQQST
jgi:hypothetical protein